MHTYTIPATAPLVTLTAQTTTADSETTTTQSLYPWSNDSYYLIHEVAETRHEYYTSKSETTMLIVPEVAEPILSRVVTSPIVLR